ncbi:MAG: pilus assembly protein TadG-related protein [Steroidobacteraceae bacterium]
MNASRQRGVVAVLFTFALFAVAALAGLALDSSHLGTNKARLQTVLDAAALAAAKTLDQTGSTTAATAAANATLTTNRNAFPELAAAGGLSISIQYSNTLLPFSPGTTPAQFVRVTATNFNTAMSLLRVAGVQQVGLRASAVSGMRPIGSDPPADVCKIAPMMVCGTPGAGPPSYGYALNAVHVLKSGPSATVGPGNFHLVRLGGNGASDVRENLAGAYPGCVADGNNLETEPGNNSGPTSQGLNTRFGEYQGGGVNAATYPPDVVTRLPSPILTYNKTTNTIRQGSTVVTQASQINYNYTTYSNEVAAANYTNPPAPGGNGVFQRRELALPIADCSGKLNGQSTVPILGFACFFLLQKAQGQGNDSFVYGQVIQSCAGSGHPSPNAPQNSMGPHVIQLYRDAASPDS